MGSIGDDPEQHHVPILDLDVLIVGAGPSGASLACFLGSYGKSVVDAKESSKLMHYPRY
jgi:thioredoxin reductase